MFRLLLPAVAVSLVLAVFDSSRCGGGGCFGLDAHGGGGFRPWSSNPDKSRPPPGGTQEGSRSEGGASYYRSPGGTQRGKSSGGTYRGKTSSGQRYWKSPLGRYVDERRSAETLSSTLPPAPADSSMRNRSARGEDIQWEKGANGTTTGLSETAARGGAGSRPWNRTYFDGSYSFARLAIGDVPRGSDRTTVSAGSGQESQASSTASLVLAVLAEQQHLASISPASDATPKVGGFHENGSAAGATLRRVWKRGNRNGSAAGAVSSLETALRQVCSAREEVGQDCVLLNIGFSHDFLLDKRRKDFPLLDKVFLDHPPKNLKRVFFVFDTATPADALVKQTYEKFAFKGDPTRTHVRVAFVNNEDLTVDKLGPEVLAKNGMLDLVGTVDLVLSDLMVCNCRCNLKEKNPTQVCGHLHVAWDDENRSCPEHKFLAPLHDDHRGGSPGSCASQLHHHTYYSADTNAFAALSLLLNPKGGAQLHSSFGQEYALYQYTTQDFRDSSKVAERGLAAFGKRAFGGKASAAGVGNYAIKTVTHRFDDPPVAQSFNYLFAPYPTNAEFLQTLRRNFEESLKDEVSSTGTARSTGTSGATEDTDSA